MVRLKENSDSTARKKDKFQFLMVRLKAGINSRNMDNNTKFQFLMVRLKDNELWYEKLRIIISIPYGAIKREGGR